MLAEGFKTNRKSLTGQYLAIHIPKSIVLVSNTLRENRLIRDFTIRVIFLFIFFFGIIIIIFFFFSKPAISILERVDALIFFTKSFQSRRRCARSTSDLFSLAPRLYGKSLEPHRVDSERRHLLPTQHAQQGQGGCASCLRGERRRERRSVFCQRYIECGRHALEEYVLCLCFV